MSEQEEQGKQQKEPQPLTATQLFRKYMAVRGKVQKMTATLGEEVSKMGALGDELAASGLGMMEQLQSGMKGEPTVLPTPGEHEPGRPVERSNAGGGPVVQGPVPEEK